jgi:hypothetical protein
MRLPVLSHFVHQLSGRGALDNVTEVLAERQAVTARIEALSVRITATVPVPVVVAEAA